VPDDDSPKDFDVTEMDGGAVAMVYDCDGTRTPEQIRAVADFIAAANPAAILALYAERDEARAALQRLAAIMGAKDGEEFNPTEVVEAVALFQARFGTLMAEADQLRAALREAQEDRPWLVVKIGCIECGVSSNIVGRYADEAKAKSVAEALDNELSWREGGQDAFEVFDLRAPMADEYRAAASEQPSKEPHP
jgi:hypothetical protein